MAENDLHASDSDDCEDAVEALYMYLDGELTAEGRFAVRQHLEDCSPCFEAFDFEAELKIVVATRCRDEIPAELRERILAALKRPAPRSGGPSA